MICKHCLYILLFFWFGNVVAQNNQILFDFNQLPQTLLLNPGAEVDYNKHFGVPFLSNIFVQMGATNKRITYNNIYEDDTSEMLRNIYEQELNSDDYFILNQNLEILNGGFRLKNEKYYLSFGVIQKTEGFSLYPEEPANLFFKGNDQDGDGKPDDDNEKFSFNQISFIGELLNVFHIGISKRINDKLTLGARFKLLSGALNVDFTNTFGDYYLSKSTLFNKHNFNNMTVAFRSSGLINREGDNILTETSQVLKGLFFLDGNIGAGIDLGLTYHASDEIIITASLLDLDYINYSNKVVKYEIKDDFELFDQNYFDPAQVKVPPEDKVSELSYWKDKLGNYVDDPNHIGGYIDIDTLQTSYNTIRSPKFNASAKYQITRSSNEKYNSVYRNSKYVTPIKRVLLTEFGMQTYMAFRPGKLVWAVTPFISRDINRYLTAKITYTYNEFSATNIGLGISTHFKSFNFYVTADNLLNLPKWKDSNYQSVQMGMNFMFF